MNFVRDFKASNGDDGLTVENLENYIAALEKEISFIGQWGSGVTLASGGSSGDKNRRAAAQVGGKGPITIYSEYFVKDSKGKFVSYGGYIIAHEATHAILGLSDRVPANLVGLIDGYVFPDRDDPKTNLAYRSKGVTAARSEGLTITDSFVCAGGFKC